MNHFLVREKKHEYFIMKNWIGEAWYFHLICHKLYQGEFISFVHTMTFDNQVQEDIIKIHAYYGAATDDLYTYKWANGADLFPAEDKRHANGRRQAALKSIRRGGNRWKVPAFTPEMFSQLQRASVLSLYQQSLGVATGLPTSSTSTTMRSSTARANDDDESADLSFTNEDVSFTPGKKKKKKSKKSVGNDDDLAVTTAMANLSISDDNKDLLHRVINYINTNGESASELLELIHTRSSVFVEDAKLIQLVQALQQNLLPFLAVIFNERMVDDLTKKKRSLIFKIALRSPKDADQVSNNSPLPARLRWILQITAHLCSHLHQYHLKPSAIGATEDGYSCFTFEYPEVSAAEADTIVGLNKSIELQLKEYATGNSKAEKDKADADNVTRRNKMEHLIAAAHEDNDVTKPVKVVSKVLKLPKFNNIQQRTELDHWQGTKYNVDCKGTEEVKFRLNYSIGDIKGNDGFKYAKHVAWFLVAEIPLVGGDELTMKSPEPKKVMNEQTLFNALLNGA